LSEAYATIVSPVDNRPLLIATQESAGACFRWIHDVLSDESPNLDGFLNGALKAGAVSPPLFLPWLAGERVPADDHRLRGAFLGLSLSHDRHSLIRAVLEGVALNTRWAFRTVIRQSGVRRDLPVPLVGEGATNPSFCQMLADCLERELTAGLRPQLAGVRGAACLAAAGLGWAASPWLAARLPDNQDKRTFKPDPIRAQYFRRRFDLYLRAYRRTAPWFRHAFATMQRGAAE
jgi:xylulokinase